MSGQHTRGPWRVIIDDTGGEFTGWPSIVAPDDVDATVVHRAGFKQTYWGDLSPRETAHNALLIAAAPELLAALVAILGPLNVCTDNANVSDDTLLPVDMTMGEVRLARAAILKATGESSLRRTA